MKKLGILVIPLMAISLLASCGGSKPQVVEHFVTFESYGGGHFPTQRVKDGETATPPTEEPIRGDDDFLGWFTDFDQPAYTFKEKVTGDITLYAGWEVEPDPETTCNFKFTGEHCSINGYKDEPFEITLPKGTQTQFQIDPDNGYLFPANDENHFKLIKGSIDEYDATKGLIKIGNMSGDIEIRAKSEPALVETYTITFHDGSVTEPEIKDIEPGSTITTGIPTVPAKSGFTPIGWCTDEAGTKVLDFATVKIYQDYDLYPGYTKNPEPAPTYTITFDKNGGTLGDDAEESIDNIGSGAEWGSIVDKTTQIASKTNHTFVGWGLSPNTPDKIEDSYRVTDSFTAYAIFNPVATAIIKLTADSENCKLYYGGSYHERNVLFDIPADEEVILKIEPNSGYLPVFKDKLSVDGAVTSKFDPGKKEVTIKASVGSTCNVTAKTNMESKENLEAYGWDEIKTISEKGIAPAVFKVGDEKTVKVNNLDHKVRIIGFNHDYSELPDDGNNPDPNKVLGITFEFANVITKSSAVLAKTIWDGEYEVSGYNYDYRKSVLNTFLNNDVLNMLPSTGDPSNPDLREVIKQVDKKVEVSTDDGQSYTATSFDGSDDYPYPYLFSLAHDEIVDNASWVTEGEGSKYQYYIEHPNETDRIKRKADIESGSGETYWLRSPNSDNSNAAWNVFVTGDLYSDSVYYYACAAPAFCI